MPISGPTSYVPTAQGFHGHWVLADSSLGLGNEIVLHDGTTAADLNTQTDALVAKRASVKAKLNLGEAARGDVEIKKAGLIKWLNRFNKRIRARFPDSKWLAALPHVPSKGAAPGPFTEPMDDANSLWAQINAEVGAGAALTLLGGFTQANFAADLDALNAAYKTLSDANVAVSVVRGERNELQDQIYAILKRYREDMPTNFEEKHALVASLPRLTPLPGATPKPVNITAMWDEAEQQARITWEASTEANLDHYEVRVSPGPKYSTDDEDVIGTVQPDQPRVHLTQEGLPEPGTTAGYKVYVIVTTGNEKGSKAVIVNRPGPPEP